jgi:hypothetical protein
MNSLLPTGRGQGGGFVCDDASMYSRYHRYCNHYGDSDCHGDSHSHCHCYGNTHSNRNGDVNTNGYGHRDRDSHRHSDDSAGG